MSVRAQKVPRGQRCDRHQPIDAGCVVLSRTTRSATPSSLITCITLEKVNE
jgi:hypothetical protein